MKKLRPFFSIAVFAVFVLMLILLSSSMKINDGSTLKRNILKIFPQGWSLFMNPELRNSYKLYVERDSKFIPVTIKNAEAENFFGLSRKARKIDAERQWFNHQLPDSLWTVHPPG